MACILIRNVISCSFVLPHHPGAKVAHYAGQHLHTKLANQVSFKRGEIVEAIKSSFLNIDEDMLKGG